MSSSGQRCLVLGLGNTIAGDDAVGILVAERLGELLQGRPVEVRTAAVGGLELLDLVLGFDRVVVIDSISTTQARPGAVLVFRGEDMEAGRPPLCPHRAGLGQAIVAGRLLGAKMPAAFAVYAVNISAPRVFSEGLSPAIRQVVAPLAGELARREFAMDLPGERLVIEEACLAETTRLPERS